MGAELDVLASTAATTLVGLMATDAWQQARAAIGRVWRKARPEQAERITVDLDDAELAVARARQRHDDAVEAAVLIEWQGRIASLILTHPTVRAELQSAVRQLEALTRAAPSGPVTMHANARDQARIYQAARDLVIKNE